SNASLGPLKRGVRRLLGIVVRTQKVEGNIRLVPDHPAVVRDLRDIEQLAGPKLEYPSVLQRSRRRARDDQPDMRHPATPGADGRADVLAPPPPRLVSCWANSETANVYDFELSLLHYACLVGGLEPPKDHLDLRSSHESPRLIHTMSVEL